MQRGPPAGFDPSKDKFGKCWVQKFTDRKDLSVRRATNIKKDSVFEKLHKVHRYHWWTQFRLGDDPISSESECSDDENFDNCVDAAAEPEDESSEDESSQEESSEEESSTDESS